MANRITTKQEAIYEVTVEDVEEMILDGLSARLGETLPFSANKVTVQFSDPENGIYQIRIERDEELPQVMPLRETRPEPVA